MARIGMDLSVIIHQVALISTPVCELNELQFLGKEFHYYLHPQNDIIIKNYMNPIVIVKHR